VKVLYVRCPYGHFFQGALCPYDATEAPDTTDLERRLESNPHASIDELKASGIPDSLLRKVVIIDSQIEDLHCDAFKLASIVRGGSVRKFDEYGRTE
jgi:hypothetical protein